MLQQIEQPLDETQHEALLLIAAGQTEELKGVKLLSAVPLLDRGYIALNKTKQGSRLIVTKAGRELIPSLVLHQAE